MWDVVSAIREGKARFEWEEVISAIGEDRLYISVMRDAMKFDGVPAMDFKRTPLKHVGKTYDGVRLPATAAEMQRIADMLGCMLLTPKIIDLTWRQAVVKFDPVININGKIVATCNIHDVHEEIERKIRKIGGYSDRGIVSSVGKYWVLSNRLASHGLTYGKKTCCNYGWTSSDGRYTGVTEGVKLWQSEGTRHDDSHLDPSQTIKLMYRMARLIRSDSKWERVDLHDIAKDKYLCRLINHNGVLSVLRQPSVKEPEPKEIDGILTMPEVVVYPNIPPPEMDGEQLRTFITQRQIKIL